MPSSYPILNMSPPTSKLLNVLLLASFSAFLSICFLLSSLSPSYVPAATPHAPHLGHTPIGTPNRTPRKMHHLMPIGKGNVALPFCITLMSAFVHGYEPILLNWEETGNRGQLQLKKIAGMYRYLTEKLSNTDDDDIVFLMDAMDIWLQQSPDALLRRFEELGEEVVLGADRLCWPNAFNEPACEDVPVSPVPKGVFGVSKDPEVGYKAHTRPRWANSGTIIGTVRALKPIDQGLFNEYLYQGRVTLDYWYRLFWATSKDADSGQIVGLRYSPDPTSPLSDSTLPLHLVPPVVQHRLTGEIPVAVHFNDPGHKQKFIDEWWGTVWWTRSDRRFRRLVRDRLEGKEVLFAHDGRRMAWGEICPESVLNLTITEDWTEL